MFFMWLDVMRSNWHATLLNNNADITLVYRTQPPARFRRKRKRLSARPAAIHGQAASERAAARSTTTPILRLRTGSFFWFFERMCIDRSLIEKKRVGALEIGQRGCRGRPAWGGRARWGLSRACVVVCEEKEELSAASEASSTVSVQEQESEKRPRKSAKKRQNKWNDFIMSISTPGSVVERASKEFSRRMHSLGFKSSNNSPR